MDFKELASIQNLSRVEYNNNNVIEKNYETSYAYTLGFQDAYMLFKSKMNDENKEKFKQFMMNLDDGFKGML